MWGISTEKKELQLTTIRNSLPRPTLKDSKDPTKTNKDICSGEPLGLKGATIKPTITMTISDESH